MHEEKVSDEAGDEAGLAGLPPPLLVALGQGHAAGPEAVHGAWPPLAAHDELDAALQQAVPRHQQRLHILQHPDSPVSQPFHALNSAFWSCVQLVKIRSRLSLVTSSAFTFCSTQTVL